jgi:cytochrome c oxidase accessory protein FixG
MVTTALVFFDFAYFREQMCTVICPYARLQSVLLDRGSLIVGYDARRGEPRSRGKARPGSGDCIDCSACVTACPTGIDIRQGLQLECVACAQCIDACDSIMDKIKKPRGLIRYGAQATLEQGIPRRILRPRLVAYGLLFTILLIALVAFGGREARADVTVLRGIGAPFQMDAGLISNQIRIKVRNRTGQSQSYGIELLDGASAKLVAPENPLSVAASAQRQTSVFVLSTPDLFVNGQRHVRFRVSDGHGQESIQSYELLGPKERGGNAR